MTRRMFFILAAVAATLLWTEGVSGADRPLAGIAILKSNSPRTLAMTPILGQSLSGIAEGSGVFSAVNPALLREELVKFGCTGENCLLGFAADAGISLLVRADLDDSNDFVIMTLTAYGIGFPYHGRVVYRRTVQIPMSTRYGAPEFTAIIDEHAGFFFAEVLSRWRTPYYFTGEAEPVLLSPRRISGDYDLYRPGETPGGVDVREFRKVGTVRLAGGSVVRSSAPVLQGDLILAGYRETARELESMQYGRKREIVLRPVSAAETVYALLLAAPAGAVMPIIAPTAGYYRNRDWAGLGLWALNVAPYLYLEIDGLTTYWADYHKRKRSVPREVRARYHFGLYMLSAGGVSLFADAFAHGMLRDAANYLKARPPLLGNPATAGLLALIGGGAGHFYRGRRAWGYCYYHVDNILLYFTLREFSPGRTFNPITRSFSTGKINKTRAFSLLSVAGAIRIAEIVHAVLIRDSILNGKIIREGHSIEPILYSTADAMPVFGIHYSYRW
ncbi:MAG: hypothetical protein JW838_00450 [Spirochaetes bacterium]|nr:hypothetical protein [Spirochaetota bacterium]